jgi:CRISPR system Cascade subunit CasB
MNTLEISESNVPQATPAGTSATGHPIGKLAGVIDRADPGTRAALARLDPEAMRPHQIAALCRSLIEAGLSPDTWHPSTWKRWALVAHGMALAGHDGKGRLGAQFANAGVAEARVTKLLVSREDAFLQIVPRLLRLLASKQVKPNWYTLSELIHKNDAQGQAHEAAEALRLRIAGDYFSAATRTN